MSLETWALYFIAILILTASPGPSSLLCMTKGVTQGFKVGVLTALGSLSAITIILTLSFTGLGLIIASSELVFNVIKYVGAAYLIYLGIRALMSKEEEYQLQQGQTREVVSPLKHYVSGFIVGSSNPKAILFFTALFPQFINPELSLVSQYLIFTATFIVMEFSWLAIYAFLGAKSSNWLFAKGRAKIFNRVTGGVFIGAGSVLSTATKA
ncbi:flagellar biosynthesis protein FlgM [Vibrio ponticus]|uniref:Flagellar biosynthesis protein FlgM n=1 Tax=Vibrio ponticus TaxID=265668 RepID=A0A3N3DTA5_9VIBR|nr:LysE family translocator [Vibrio ponticus]OLQ94102.1 flagellar biosynthesis protein FlgM [Vibrio ponticus]ROV57626.1 LysE family translocator [Vibrio ponticus]